MVIAEEKLLAMYETMARIRLFEEEALRVQQEGHIPGLIHSYIGEEAVASGVCAALEPADYVVSTHRGHGHCIAKGVGLEGMMAELMGKASGHCKGRGGSMHIADFSVGMLGANGVVAAGIPIGTGAALGLKLQGRRQVVACFFGDGASNQGTFHEGLNLASIWGLPIVFVCENNQYAISTPQRKAQKIRDIAVRASAYDIPGVVVDGNDVTAVYEKAVEAVARARSGEGPTLLECKTYRVMGHYSVDPCVYRSKEEVEQQRARDPILMLKKTLLSKGLLSEEKASAIEEGIKAQLAQAVRFAIESGEPEASGALDFVYA